MTTIYIAAAFQQRHLLRSYTARLSALGYTLLDRWIHLEHDARSSEERLSEACRDIEDVKRADLFILDTTPNTTNGHENEFGMACTRMIPRYLVGVPRSVFHEFTTMKFQDWEECLAFFETHRPGLGPSRSEPQE